jgi:hypothetical protein
VHLVNWVTTTPLRAETAQVKWVMRCQQFRLLLAERQRQLPLVQTTRVHYSTTRKWCVGVTTSTASLVKGTWTTLVMVLV